MELADRIGRRVKLRDLNILIALAQRGSMAKAARHLATSQSVVSKAVADLERAFGVRLFDRNAQGVELTAYGRALLDRGTAMFDELKQSAHDIEFLADPTLGELRIGCTEWLEAGLVSLVIEKLSRKYPRVVFHVDHAHTAMADYRELRSRSFDIAVVRIPSPFNEKDLDAEILFEEPIFVVAGSTSKWAKRRKVSLAELVDEPWLLTPPDTLPRSLVEEAFRAYGLEVPTPSVVSYNYHVRNSLVSLGRFLTVVPGSGLHFNVARVPMRCRSPCRSARGPSQSLS